MSTVACLVEAEPNLTSSTLTSTPSFADLGLSEPTLRALADLGYEEPTPIQVQTIMRLLAGADVIAQAQTGTGKTAAFALPILERLDPAIAAPQALVLTPTRELAVQVAEAFCSYGKHRKVSVLAIYGGQPIERQLRALYRGVQVVVGTPGRVLDHLRRGTLRLDGVRTVVLDEADEMLDMGFVDDIQTILEKTPKERQTALFSATMPGPIVALSRRYLRDAERVTVRTEHLTVPQIRQVYYEVGSRDKFEVLARVLDFEAPSSAIIFCRTKGEVDSLGERLLERGLPAETLHGDLSQMQRDRVMQRFRSGAVELLVATDVAARGLDIEQVSHVINYDLPVEPGVYVHRIGRTGRAGRSGCAVTLVTPRERRLLRLIERVIGAPLLRSRLPTMVDVIARRHESFKETLRETVAADLAGREGEAEGQGEGVEASAYLGMAKELLSQHDAASLLAATFKLLLGEEQGGAADLLSQQEPETRDERRVPSRPGYRDGYQNGGRESGREGGREPGREPRSTQNVTRLFLNIGREDGVRPADLVGAIANEAGIPGRTIGAIELFGRFSFVEVPSPKADLVMEALRNTLVRGRRIAPSVARPA